MVITFADALQEMEKGPFSIAFVKFDKRNKANNGHIRTFENAVLVKNRPRTKAQSSGNFPEAKAKDPDHYTNSTRNIYIDTLPVDQRIKKVHINLILTVNGKEVYP